MFAISLVLVVLISAAILLYQYWSGALADAKPEGTSAELRALPGDERPARARAA